MARVTHVKKAQQRYETRPVLDADGQPVKIPLTGKDGTPKMTSAKGGKRTSRPVSITKTVADKSRPKPLHVCGKCQTTIQVGQPYKWIKPKSGPYGGRLMVRCGPCPTWHIWEYSSSLSARVAQIEYDADLTGVESQEDAQAIAGAAAESIRELAEEKREAASNIEGGFGHATSQSEELEGQADTLATWADEVENVEFPDPEDSEYVQDDVECDDCQGTGRDDDDNDACTRCDGAGTVEDEDQGTDWDAWREAAQSALEEVLGNCPV